MAYNTVMSTVSLCITLYYWCITSVSLEYHCVPPCVTLYYWCITSVSLEPCITVSLSVTVTFRMR